MIAELFRDVELVLAGLSRNSGEPQCNQRVPAAVSYQKKYEAIQGPADLTDHRDFSAELGADRLPGGIGVALGCGNTKPRSTRFTEKGHVSTHLPAAAKDSSATRGRAIPLPRNVPPVQL